MPFQDAIQKHFTPAEVAQCDTLLGQLEALLQPKLHNLDEDENQKYGVIDEKRKLFVDKDRDYRNNQPALSSPDVDWTEFELDYGDRKFLETRSDRMLALVKSMTETRRIHDYDNDQNARIDYGYTQYKNKTEPGKGYDSKEAELKQFFSATGGGKTATPPTPPTP